MKAMKKILLLAVTVAALAAIFALGTISVGAEGTMPSQGAVRRRILI